MTANESYDFNAGDCRRRRLAADCRGSIFVEALVYIPLLALVWVLLIHTQKVNTAELAVQERARSCAWRHATRGCRAGPPTGCEGAVVEQVDDLALRLAARHAFDELAEKLPFLAPTLQSLHGDLVRVRTSYVTERPPALGGARTSRGSHTMMCNTPTREWEVTDVFQQTCERLLGRWCP